MAIGLYNTGDRAKELQDTTLTLTQRDISITRSIGTVTLVPGSCHYVYLGTEEQIAEFHEIKIATAQGQLYRTSVIQELLTIGPRVA